MEIETANWSGEGTFTQTLVERLRDVEQVASLRVEDAPATRSDADYNFVSNEIFVTFHVRERREPGRRLGFLPVTRVVAEKVMTFDLLASMLAELKDIGPADYADDGMIQYLRSERIIPPYQTRGYKLVELVRIYEAGTPPRP